MILLHIRRGYRLILSLNILRNTSGSIVLLGKHGLVVFIVKNLGLVVSKLLKVLLKNLLLSIVVGTWHKPSQLLKHLLLIVLKVVLGLRWLLRMMLSAIAVKKLCLGRLVELLVHLLKLLNASVAIYKNLIKV